jgi:YihY family inner membrane protein
MASAAVLVNRLHQAPEPPEPTGLVPVEPDGVLARVAARRAALRFPMAVVQRFSKLRCGMLAGVVAFAGFLSLFPLLIALNTGLDLVLSGRPRLRHRLVSSAAGSIPVVGDQLRVGTSKGSGLALALGLAGAIWAALAAMNALQTAIDDVWQVEQRPNFAAARLRSAAGLAVVGTALVAATGLSGMATASSLPLSSVWGGVAGLGVNVVGVAAAQVVLCPDVRWSDTWAGAALSGVMLTVLQVLGGLLVTRYLVGASATYGTFATVIALTSWFGLNAQAVLLGVCWNAERAARRRLPGERDVRRMVTDVAR